MNEKNRTDMLKFSTKSMESLNALSIDINKKLQETSDTILIKACYVELEKISKLAKRIKVQQEELVRLKLPC